MGEIEFRIGHQSNVSIGGALHFSIRSDIYGFTEADNIESYNFPADEVLNVSVTIATEKFDQLRSERRTMYEVLAGNCSDGLLDVYNYYPADVTINGQLLWNVGLRTKGFLGSINPERPSLKVKLQEYENDLLYKGRKRFTFNNNNQDPARLKTCMSYYIFRKMGVPASRCNFAHMYVNGKDYGIYSNVEPLKKPFLARAFGDDDGNLYEGTIADLRTGFRARLQKKTNEKENDWSDIDDLIEIIEAPDDHVFSENISKVLNITAFIRFSIAEILVGHWDGFGSNTNNYYIYRDPITDKFYFIPWGPDGTFDNSSLLVSGTEIIYTSSLLNQRFYAIPKFRALYRKTMRTLLNEIWNTEEFLAEFDRMKSLISELDNKISGLDRVRYFIKNRKAILLRLIDAEIYPSNFTTGFKFPDCLNKNGNISIVNGIAKWGSFNLFFPEN